MMISPCFHGEGWPVSGGRCEGSHAGARLGKHQFRAAKGGLPAIPVHWGESALAVSTQTNEIASKEEGVGSVSQQGGLRP